MNTTENKVFKTILGSSIPRQSVYSKADLPTPDSSLPGQPPYTRGLYSNMYRTKDFTTRQLTGCGSPSDTNRRIKFIQANGGTGLNILFDIPTIQMYDSDHPFSKGQIGMSGVCVDSVEDMKIIFDGIDLTNNSISLVTHYPSNTSILFAMFLVMAEEQGVDWTKLKGSVQNDTTMEELVRSGPEYIPPSDCFRLQCDNIEFIKENIPAWNFITLNGYNLREFGTSAITEMAVAISNGIQTIKTLLKRGHSIDSITPRITFFWSISNDFFEEVARLRAVRRLWYKIIKNDFKATILRSTWMKCHVQTSGITLFQQEPLNNIVRSAYQALAAVLGGVQSLHVDSYDEAYSLPTEESALVSLRTQQIIQEETAITNVSDPLGGSYYVESLTNEIEKKIVEELKEIDEAGGYLSLIESGKLFNKISDYSYQQHKDIESGEIKVVGFNSHETKTKLPDINVFRYSIGIEREQIRRITELKNTRDNFKVDESLALLKSACLRSDNIFPYFLECARVRCTVGEMSSAIKSSFGLWERLYENTLSETGTRCT